MNKEGIKWVSRSQQLFDSALPTGAYAHSFGLEGMVQDGEIEHMQDVVEFIENEVAKSMIYADLPVFREAYRAQDKGLLDRLITLEELGYALRQTRELRDASSRIGNQTWRLYGKVLKLHTTEHREYTMSGKYLVHHDIAVVSAVLSRILQIPEKHAIVSYLRQVVVNFVQCCIKLIHTGPSLVQETAFSLNEQFSKWIAMSETVTLEETGIACPRWDIASSRHAYANQRLYIS